MAVHQASLWQRGLDQIGNRLLGSFSVMIKKYFGNEQSSHCSFLELRVAVSRELLNFFRSHFVLGYIPLATNPFDGNPVSKTQTNLVL